MSGRERERTREKAKVKESDSTNLCTPRQVVEIHMCVGKSILEALLSQGGTDTLRS